MNLFAWLVDIITYPLGKRIDAASELYDLTDDGDDE